MKRFLAGSLAGVTALAVTAGCANQFQQLEPKLELRQAAEELGATGKAGFTLKAGGNVEDLIALAKKDDSTFTAEDADVLRKLYNSSFTVAWDKAGEGVADDKALINATVDGVTGAEVRVVDQIAYVRVPVGELVTKFGGTQADIDEVGKEAGSAIPGIDALLAGSWVSVDAKELQKLAGGAAGVTPSADPSADNEKLAAELKTSATNLLEGADVVRDEKDKTHLVVTTTTVKAWTEAKRFVQAASKLAGERAGQTLDEALGAQMEKAPADKPIVLDIWVDNGEFTAFEINLLQFAEGVTGRASLRVEAAAGADITAPGEVTKLDVAKIVEAVAGAAGAGATGSGRKTGDAATWAELIGSQATLKALSEGGKPARYLKQTAADMTIPGVTVKVIDGGKAQVTSGGSVVCLTVPATTSGEPKVVEGAC